jgi:flotillin
MAPYIIPAVILAAVLVLMLSVVVIFKFYVKVPPNKAAVFYGSKSKLPDGKPVGARIINRGGSFRKPWVESVAWLDLNIRSLELKVENIPTIDFVPVTIIGVANIKIKSETVALNAAAERFLDLSNTAINNIVLENLLGHLRAIAGTMKVDQLIRDRVQFNEKVLEEAGQDLEKMGLQVDLLKIQDIRDSKDYIVNLGKPKAAEVARDAVMATAVAKSEGDQKSAIADQEARTVEAKNAADIAEANKERDVRKAQYAAETQKQVAIANQAGPKADAEAQQDVVKAQTALKEREAERREAALKAEVIKPAEAARQTAIIEAEANQKRVEIAAEAEKVKKTKEAEGQAAAVKALGEAEGAKILAIATAEAEGIKLKLLAEAAGIMEKAKAMHELDESGKLIVVLEKIPPVIMEYAKVVAEAAKPMAGIDNVTILDMGGDNSDGPARFASNTTKVIAGASTALKAGTGIDIPAMLQDISNILASKVSTKDPKDSK